MLKDIDKYDTSAHFTYKEYKKKVKRTPNKDIMVFASVFIIGVFMILGFVKILSPNVDVGITNDNEIASYDDADSNSSVIDERLRSLKLEDEGKAVTNEEMFSPELDEKVVLPSRMRSSLAQKENDKSQETKTQQQKDDNAKSKDEKSSQASSDSQKTQVSAKNSQASDQIVNAKVVVGYYATEKQAEVAKSIMQDAGLDVTPIIKNLGGYYTLQVGSYSSRDRAQQAANSLLKNNFPARVYIEQ